MNIWDKLRATEARLEQREAEQAMREHEPKLRTLEKLANGIAKAHEKQEMAALKKRVGKLQREAGGFLDVAPDDAATALREASELSQRNERRNREAVESIRTADRETRWRLERARIYRERARLKREAEDHGWGYLEPPHLPTSCPDWWNREPDGVRVTVHRPSVPQPVHNADGTVTLSFEQDVIGGSRPGPELLTAEESLRRKFAEAEGR